jgi:hypothetical protein
VPSQVGFAVSLPVTGSGKIVKADVKWRFNQVRMFPECSNVHSMIVRNVDPTPTGEVRAGKTILRVIG